MIILKKFVIILYGLLLIVCCVPALAETGLLPRSSEHCGTDASIERLAAKFRSARSIAGHFNGGTWNEETDRWMGCKHKLMIELGLRLGAGEFSQNKIAELLGPPDRIARKGDRLFDLITALPGFTAATAVPDEFMVYFWRGMHDFLFFTGQEGVVISSDWWHAGE